MCLHAAGTWDGHVQRDLHLTNLYPMNALLVPFWKVELIPVMHVSVIAIEYSCHRNEELLDWPIRLRTSEVPSVRFSGVTKGFEGGTRSWSIVCAKKQTRLRHLGPSLHNWLLYLHKSIPSYLG